MQPAVRSCQTHSQIKLVLLWNVINKLGEECGGWRAALGRSACSLWVLLLDWICVCVCVCYTCVTDGLPEVRRCGRGPPTEADYCCWLSGVPRRALLRKAGAFRYSNAIHESKSLSLMAPTVFMAACCLYDWLHVVGCVWMVQLEKKTWWRCHITVNSVEHFTSPN